MTSPPLYEGAKRLTASTLEPRRWMRMTVVLTLAGGAAAAAASWIAGKNDLALGFFSGAVLSTLNFYSLKILTEKVSSLGDRKGKRRFWFWNIVRWGLFGAACWFFLSVSKLCLLGAGSSYLWFLAALVWVGWRSASSSKAPGRDAV